MPPAIHPVDLIQVLRHKQLTPAIVFLTSRRACDEAIDSFEYRHVPLPPKRSAALKKVLEPIIEEFPSIAQHPLIPMVEQYGVAAHHAGHLPSWKIAVEELMRKGHLDAVFATTTLAAGVDFPARTVVITQSSVRKAQDFMELTVSEIQQLAGRGGRRGKDFVGFVVVTPSPYIDISHIAKGLTGNPEAIDSQFVISYPMVLNLLKAHSIDHIQPILEKSFAQFQVNQRADSLESKLNGVEQQLAAFGQRECADWITQWQSFELAKHQRSPRHLKVHHELPEVNARLAFITPGRVIGLSREKAIVLRQYRSRGQAHAMLTVLRSRGRIVEYPASSVTEVFDQTLIIAETRSFPWCSAESLNYAMQKLDGLPTRLRHLPIRVQEETPEKPILKETLHDKFFCLTCPSKNACGKDHPRALRLQQESHRITKIIHTLRTELWHSFQQHIKVLQKFGYLTTTCQLTSDGEWARFIRINHSLLITELIRMDAFTGIEPAILTGVLASISHDDDRPGAFPHRSPALGNVLRQVRTVAHSIEAYEDSPLLRSDVAAVAELWVGKPHLPWSQLIRMTTMAEGDIYRLLARTLEYLAQLYSLKATHPSLADIADQAMEIMRRDVLEELP
jgi:superfamily II RNA helicase